MDSNRTDAGVDGKVNIDFPSKEGIVQICRAYALEEFDAQKCVDGGYNCSMALYQTGDTELSFNLDCMEISSEI